MKVNLSELADVFGISLPTARAWVKRGAPYKQKGTNGSEWVFETTDVIKWYIENQLTDRKTEDNPSANDAQELKKRRLEAETIIAELDQAKKEIELQEKKGLLVNIDDANAAIIDALTITRQRLLSVPRRVTPLVLGETDDQIVKTEIEKEIRDALNELSQHFESESDATSEEALHGDL